MRFHKKRGYEKEEKPAPDQYAATSHHNFLRKAQGMSIPRARSPRLDASPSAGSPKSRQVFGQRFNSIDVQPMRRSMEYWTSTDGSRNKNLTSLDPYMKTS